MVLVQSRTLVRYLWHLHTEQVEQLSNKLLTIVFLLLFVISIASVSRHFLGFLGWLGMRHCPRTVLLYRWHHNSGIQYLYNTALNWCLFVHACHCFSCRFRFVTQCQLSLAVLSPEGSDLGQAVGCPGQKLNWCEFLLFCCLMLTQTITANSHVGSGSRSCISHCRWEGLQESVMGMAIGSGRWFAGQSFSVHGKLSFALDLHLRVRFLHMKKNQWGHIYAYLYSQTFMKR